MYPKFDEDKMRRSLVNLRKNLGFTQKKVEEKLGLRALSMYDYESGRLALPIEHAVDLANLYNCNIEKLCGLLDEESTPKEKHDLTQLFSLGLLGHKNEELLRLISQDPVLLADSDILEINSQQNIFETITSKLTLSQKKIFLIEVLKHVNSLIGIDGHISPEEMQLRDILLANVSVQLSESEISSIKRAYTKIYFGNHKTLSKTSLKHFLIWTLYLVAFSDGAMDHREESYIHSVCEHVKLDQKNHEYIKRKIHNGLGII